LQGRLAGPPCGRETCATQQDEVELAPDRSVVNDAMTSEPDGAICVSFP